MPRPRHGAACGAVDPSLLLPPPPQDLEKHEQPAVKQLRRYLLRHDGPVASGIARQLLGHMRGELGTSGECDLRELGEQAVFWPMTAALFGAGASKAAAPQLFGAFEAIDSNFGKALRGMCTPRLASPRLGSPRLASPRPPLSRASPPTLRAAHAQAGRSRP